ncbi:hypothetical protein C7T94_09350 [Pedobacter yulinensis]|uniref:Coproporphyrinogen III oxidase n=1 Tax=Pedobacter yulinensis TaxID=2126353 RepID=A0A2T3HK51_9SPHI|nr:hypothetical protein [Pedobacter yulinensis]PST82835.1 hypothetical protein C7T94_09350 [Pedobacter yulinensis]
MKTKHFLLAALLVSGLAACSQDGHQQSSSPTLTGPTGDSSSTRSDTSATTSDTADTAKTDGETTARE